ncbi:MAG: hypothetical protein LBE44_01535 [Microbacterium hominis]|jgi:hypothetical protein|nr:hypothetical protein [Microbacterium hominis]
MIGLDFIEVDEVELGEAFPVLTDARVRPSGTDSESVVSGLLTLDRHLNAFLTRFDLL